MARLAPAVLALLCAVAVPARALVRPASPRVLPAVPRRVGWSTGGAPLPLDGAAGGSALRLRQPLPPKPGYRTNEELEAAARALVAPGGACEGLGAVSSIGTSVRGVALWALALEDPAGRSPRPLFRFVANMHGNEPLGREQLLRLAEHLCDGRRKGDAQATRLLRDATVDLLPAFNPDGYAARSRTNANRKDLNRDFPDQYVHGAAMPDDWDSRQPETVAAMRRSRARPCVAAANLHEGALVANIPYDGSPDRKTVYSAAPDDASLAALARAYASGHRTMSRSHQFRDGITNGAQWYPLYGGFQDWDYLKHGCFHLTIEQSDRKWPPEQQFETLWADHLPGMLSIMEAALFRGMRGTVVDAVTGSPLAARVSLLQGKGVPVLAQDGSGFFHRPLLPGEYEVRVEHHGYAGQTHRVVVPEDGLAELDVRLQKAGPGAGLRDEEEGEELHPGRALKSSGAPPRTGRAIRCGTLYSVIAGVLASACAGGCAAAAWGRKRTRRRRAAV